MKAYLSNWIIDGVIGGWFCGSIILSFGGLIGKSGTTGTEYLGFWTPAYLVLSIFYGVPLGVLSVMVMRLFFYNLDKCFLYDNVWCLNIATIIGGMIGGFFDPFMAAILGVVFFVIAFIWVALSGSH